MFLGVREAKGLSYYIHTTTDNYTDAGALVTMAGVDLTRIDEAIEGIIEQYEIVRKEGVPADEVEKAKSYLKGKMVLNLEDSEEFAHFLAKYELLFGGCTSLEEVMDKIDGVTAEDVSRVAADILKPDLMKIAVIGPYDDASRFEKLM